MSKGATQDNLSLDKLLSFDILTPPLSTQRKIASILSGVIYVKSSMIRINPMLSLAGYSLYDVTFENDPDSYSLFTRRTIKRGETVRIVDVGRGIFLEKVV